MIQLRMVSATAVMLLVGCAGHRSGPMALGEAQRETVMVPYLVSFVKADEEQNESAGTVGSLRHALWLANVGRHAEAGALFANLACIPSADGRAWEAACAAAAAAEFLRAGDIERFQAAAAMIPALDEKAALQAGRLVATMRGLAALAEGRTDEVPTALKPLAGK